jgi:hypothetical protein
MSANHKLIDRQQRGSNGAPARPPALLAPNPVAVLIALCIAIASGTSVALLALLSIAFIRWIGL